MGGFVLVCRVQPSTGEACPTDQTEWVSMYEFIYSHMRDLLFGAPLAADVKTIIELTCAITIGLCIPVLLGRFMRVVEKGSGF